MIKNCLEKIKNKFSVRVTVVLLALLLIFFSFWQIAQNGSAGNPSRETTKLNFFNSTATKDRPAPLEVNMLVSADTFSPNIIRVTAGRPVRLKILSHGNHSFTIDELNIDLSLRNDQTAEIEFIPEIAGTYEFYSHLGGHRETGLVGQLIVK